MDSIPKNTATMENLNPVVHDFILFCINRNGKEWPALYDKMCWVAGRRLFRGLGYAELQKLGLSLSLNHIEDTIRMIDAVSSQKQEVYSDKITNSPPT